MTGNEDVDVGALQEALEDEKMANSQLEERLRVLRDRLAQAEAPNPPPQVADVRVHRRAGCRIAEAAPPTRN